MCEDEVKAQALEVMTWTKDKPTVPGWYWCKHRLPDRDPTIAYLSNDSVTDTPLLSVCFCDGSECWLHEKCFEGWQWAGPIPLPEAP